jgi:gliding motility-associated-like protein
MKILCKTLSVVIFTISLQPIFAQYGDCSNTIDACTNPSFQIDPNQGGNNIVDFTTADNISNPSTNPNAVPGNFGCLLSGELNPTWLLINVTGNGTLEFSMGATPSGSGFGSCYDWAMWPYTAATCAGISGNTLPPVACNWNGACDGFTGMANPGNLPPGASQADFEYGINVTAGQQFILMFSNYSSQVSNVPLNFFGTAQVTCGSGSDAQICAGETATLTASGGVSYIWDASIPGFLGTNAAGDQATMNPSATTTYPVQVVFGNGTSQTLNLIVEVFAPIILTANYIAETCQGDADGIIISNAGGAVAPLTFTLSGGASATNATGVFQNLAPGSYTVTVVDANGCTDTFTNTITAGPPCCSIVLTTSNTQPSCFGACNGTVSVNVAGSTGSNTFQWLSAGVPIPGANSSTYNAACAGTYTVQVVDPLCTLTATATVTQPNDLTLTITSTNLSCFENNGGTINLTVSNGTAPYQYSINGGTTFQATGAFTSLAANNYDILVQDANGCQKTSQITLSQPDVLTASATVTNSLCNNANAPCSGMIQVTTIGGTLPYIYTWNNGLPNAPLVAPLCQNNYSVNVSDANNCNVVLTNLTVTEPLAIVISGINLTQLTCHNYCDGIAEVQTSNATSITLNSNPSQATPIFTDLCSGSYTIIAADANGCSTSQIFNLINPEPVIANFTFGPQPASILNPEITFESTSINGTTSFWYTTINNVEIIQNGTTVSYLYPENQPGNYEVCMVALNQNFCADTICQTVIIDDVFFIFVPNAFSPNNDNINETFFPIVNYYDPNNFEMLIFNRWGELIFKTESPDVHWDGTHLNSPAELGVYTWKINTKVYNSNEKKIFTGHVTLLR